MTTPGSVSISNRDVEQSVNVNNPTSPPPEQDEPDIHVKDLGKISICEKEASKCQPVTIDINKRDVQKEEQKKVTSDEKKLDVESVKKPSEEKVGIETKELAEPDTANKSSENGEKSTEMTKDMEEVSPEEEEEPVFDGTEVPGMEANRRLSSPTLNSDSDKQESVWPENAAALTNFVRQKSLVAVSTVLRRLSGKSDDGQDVPDEDKSEAQEVSEKSSWNPLSFIRIARDGSGENKIEQEGSIEDLTQPIAMKGRIILYTKLGCQECKEIRRYLHGKRLRYVEINIDVYPSRRGELEKIAGSCAVPRVFFNEVLIGGLSEMKSLEESDKLEEKIEYVVTETPSYEAPLPPVSGEDDMESGGTIDELAFVARKMKDYILIKDRFHKMRRYTDCFVGSEAVDFLSEDQYLEREDAVQFGRKLANKLFFQHIVDKNIFEDGNHFYRFLDDDPFISQCKNLPRGISKVKPRPITEISSRLRFLTCAILEAYVSEDGKHVDYRSINGSEEFTRYLRMVEELQRVELYGMPREEKLSFFINLYNMMAIHAILVWGHPSGALERRKFFRDFKYVTGGSTYSLSAIYNGILRGNQRPPYNLIKPFGANDKRLKVALPHTEPLVHFALVYGTRSGPALRCYSPGNIDKELMHAACNFLRTGGLYVDLVANISYVSTILRCYSVDFGKNEVEVLKHAANYMEPAESQAFLEMLSDTQFKVIYQPYDWGLNHWPWICRYCYLKY